MTQPDSAAGPMIAAVDVVTDYELLLGGDGLLQRVLARPGKGVLTIEATEQAPALVEHARAVANADGLVLLLTAATAWRLDVADVLVIEATRRWPDVVPRRDSLRLALHEALVNALLHGCLQVPPNLRDDTEGWLEHSRVVDEALIDPSRGSRPVLVTMAAVEEGWEVAVVDTGSGFDPPPESPTDGVAPLVSTLSARGRGVALMRAVCDRVVWHDGGRAVHLTIKPPPKDPP